MRRRCLNKNQNYRDYVAVEKRARSGVDNQDLIHIGVVFHVISKQSIQNPAVVKEYVEDILETMNQDFGMEKSESHIFSELYWSKYALFQKQGNQEIYLDYIKRAAPANLQFHQIGEPRISRLTTYEKDNTELSYWDKLIKRKVSPAVQPDKYLNLWICMGIDSPFLGYAQYPKVDRSLEELATDGVVFFVTIFPFHLYKTVIHEVGHWLGLNHLFHQEDDTLIYTDNIDDTPYQKDPTYGDPLLQTDWPISTYTENGRKKTSRHLFMNYMDYTDDLRMSMFTKNQVVKIRKVLQTTRKEYVLKPHEVKLLLPAQPTPTKSTTKPPKPVPTKPPTPETVPTKPSTPETIPTKPFTLETVPTKPPIPETVPTKPPTPATFPTKPSTPETLLHTFSEPTPQVSPLVPLQPPKYPLDLLLLNSVRRSQDNTRHILPNSTKSVPRILRPKQPDRHMFQSIYSLFRYFQSCCN